MRLLMVGKIGGGVSETHMKLGKRAVAQIAPVPGKQLLIWDTEMRGFGLRVSPGGAKSYFVQRHLSGTKRSRRVTIGRADEISTEMARKKAAVIAGQLAEGVDPVAERRKRQLRSMTLGEAFEEYIRAPKKKGGKKGLPKKARTLRDIRMQMKRFDDWLRLPVSSLTGSMVKKRHADIAEVSPAQANLAMRYLRAAINHVIADTDDDEEPIIKSNPTNRLNRLNQWVEVLPAKGRIPPERIAEWVEAVRTGLVGIKWERESRDALLFLLLTGARYGEVLGSKKDGYEPLKWEDVDFLRRRVTFRDTKNRLDHEIPLGRAAYDLLRNRRSCAGSIFVFSDAEGRLPPDLRGAQARIRKITGIRVTPHDLRRTFTTAANKIDVSAYKVKRLTNHLSRGDVTADYIQMDPEDVRDAMQRLEDYLLSPDRKPANLLSLKEVG